jgi:NADPH-dependent 2,4-dienoyl-CoA reductase/sulfur reductase-like enzyme
MRNVEVTLIGDESREPYDRPPLSKQLLSGDWTAGQATIATSHGLASNGITALLGARAAALTESGVTLADGRELPADAVVVATGSRALRLDDSGTGQVHHLRTLDDALALGQRLRACSGDVVIVGGGFVGAEVATAALKAGRQVRMVEADAGPARRAVGAELSDVLADHYRSAGVELFLGRRTRRIVREGPALAVVLDDGTRLPADDVVVGIGAAPNVEWLPGSHGDGIRCTTGGRALDLPGRTYALGDVAAWPDPWGECRRVEHWTGAVDQARVVAAAIAGTPIPPLPAPYFWSDQFGTKLQLTGWPAHRRSVARFADRAGRLTAIYLDDRRRPVAALTANAPATLARCRPLIARRATLDEIVDTARLTPAPGIALRSPNG